MISKDAVWFTTGCSKGGGAGEWGGDRLMSSVQSGETGSVLLVGASRGLGLGMSAEFAERGWRVVGTVREERPGALPDVVARHAGRVEVEHLDINAPEQIAALRNRLGGRRFDILFVNAGMANGDETIAEVSTEAFVQVMVTNALSPMRVIEGLQALVTPDGLIGVMSSGQGSIANNTLGGKDVYRASKAALNQLMRCYAARRVQERRALILMAPG